MCFGEKPMLPDKSEIVKMGEYSRKYARILSVCHVLRYSPLFTKLKSLLEEGRIGRLMSIQHIEEVGYWHHVHSFVRGNWRNAEMSSPMILQKCCHDMDILLWLADSRCKRISSFGALTYFKEENAPKARRRIVWMAARIGTTALFTRPGFIWSIRKRRRTDWSMRLRRRRIRLMGTRGEMKGDMEQGTIEIADFTSGMTETIRLHTSTKGHGGSDMSMTRDFVRMIGEGKQGKTDAAVSVESHLMALAAEESRVEGRSIDFSDYVRQIKNEE